MRENLALLTLSPQDDGGLPYLIWYTGDLQPAVAQSVTLEGANLLQTFVKSTLDTNDGVLNTEINWEAVLPGASGDLYTLQIANNPAGGAIVVTTPTATAIVVTIDNTNPAFRTAAQVVAAVLAHATARQRIRGTITGTGGGTVTVAAAANFSGGSGQGEFDIEPAARVTAITRWTDTAIDVIFDLSGYTDGDMIQTVLIADGIEYEFPLRVLAAGSKPKAERIGVGYLDITGDTAAAESFIIGTETWTFQAGAPAAQFEVQESLAAGAAVAAARVAAALNDPVLGSDLVSAVVIAGSTVVALLPLDASLAGNYVLDATLTANMTDQDMQSGAADPFEGGYPVTYLVSVADVAHWLAGRFVAVAGYPFPTQPLLYSVMADRAGNLIGVNGIDYRVAQHGAGFWQMEIQDGIALFQAGDVIRFILGQ